MIDIINGGQSFGIGVFRETSKGDSLLANHCFGENVKGCCHGQAEFVAEVIKLLF